MKAFSLALFVALLSSSLVSLAQVIRSAPLRYVSSRPYYPSDLYRYRTPVIFVIRDRSRPVSTYLPAPAMPSMVDNSGAWVEAEKYRQSNGAAGVDAARALAEKIDREKAEKQKSLRSN